MMLKSRYVVPVDAPVIENGGVVVHQERIAAVGAARTLHDPSVIDYGNAVICPGFVNAHTHLELSLLAGETPPSPDFAGWLQGLTVLSTQRAATRKEVHEAILEGVDQSLASGVTTIGDITRWPQWTREVLAASMLRGVSFGEVIAIGSRRGLLAERLDAAASTEWQTQRLRTGISPHAPYTVEPDGMRACAERASRTAAPLCVHLAESADEDAFTRLLEGRLVDYLRALDVWDDNIPVSRCGPVELAQATGVLGKRTVVAHANYVSDEDIALLARSGASVAYCPCTHRAFGHPPHRFVEMLAAGVNVCVGTDSLASNPSLSVLEELRFLRRKCPGLSADEIIAMGTLRGAQALGQGDTAGSITPGKLADLIVVPLDGRGWDRILESGERPVEVYASGVPRLGARKHVTE